MPLAQTVEAASYSVGTVCGGLACILFIVGFLVIKIGTRNAKNKYK